jgi:hypothetical protein
VEKDKCIKEGVGDKRRVAYGRSLEMMCMIVCWMCMLYIPHVVRGVYGPGKTSGQVVFHLGDSWRYWVGELGTVMGWRSVLQVSCKVNVYDHYDNEMTRSYNYSAYYSICSCGLTGLEMEGIMIYCSRGVLILLI